MKDIKSIFQNMHGDYELNQLNSQISLNILNSIQISQMKIMKSNIDQSKFDKDVKTKPSLTWLVYPMPGASSSLACLECQKGLS